MGHDVPTLIGTNQRRSVEIIRQHQRGYMAMGSDGMASMGEMEMPLPANTVPMMAGWGQHGPLEMGGMFSVVKVRPDIARDDYSDPGWYQNPPGTEASEWTGDLPEATRNTSSQTVYTPRPGS